MLPLFVLVVRVLHNLLYTGRPLHCYMYMLDESIGHFKDAGSILSLLLYFFSLNFIFFQFGLLQRLLLILRRL